MKKITLFLLLLIVGCSKGDGAKAVAATPEVKQPAPHIATLDEWTSALKGAYKEGQTKDKGDGISTSAAIFFDENQKEIARSGVERDTFRQLRIFDQPYFSGDFRNISPLLPYVSVIDGKKPSVLISAHYEGRKWLNMNKVSIMADGEIVLEKELSSQEVKRNVNDGLVNEDATFIASNEDIQALRKITSTSKVLVRYTGDNTYFSLKTEKGRDQNDIFKGMMIEYLYIYDTLTKAVEGHTPP